jgi:CDP-diacylglycerol--glycerol-3-phosphate 3-phosphatidyltransferase
VSIYTLKTKFQALLRPGVRRLHKLGVTANQVTIAPCLISIALGAFLIRAPRVWFALVPLWMFVRMGLNAVDGMLAREFGQKSALGAYLNELTDVLSGVVAVMAGATRRYDGPMGKSDRAFVFSLLALWVALQPSLPPWAGALMWGIAALVTATIVNRIRGGLRESSV